MRHLVFKLCRSLYFSIENFVVSGRGFAWSAVPIFPRAQTDLIFLPHRHGPDFVKGLASAT